MHDSKPLALVLMPLEQLVRLPSAMLPLPPILMLSVGAPWLIRNGAVELVWSVIENMPVLAAVANCQMDGWPPWIQARFLVSSRWRHEGWRSVLFLPCRYRQSQSRQCRGCWSARRGGCGRASANRRSDRARRSSPRWRRCPRSAPENPPALVCSKRTAGVSLVVMCRSRQGTALRKPTLPLLQEYRIGQGACHQHHQRRFALGAGGSHRRPYP